MTNKYLATYLMTISGSVAAIELLEDLVAGKSKQIGPESEFAVLSLKKEKPDMLSWSITFLIIGLIAGVLGLSGVAGAATQIAWILFVVFLVLFLVSLIMGRRPPV